MTESHSKVTFRIDPKPGGGFVATSENPALNFEGATREEVENKVRAQMVQIFGPEIAAMLPVNFSDQSAQALPNNFPFNVKKSLKIGGGTNAGSTGEAAPLRHFVNYGTSAAGPTISSSSAFSEEDFGPVRRTGDGSAAMTLLRILIAAGVVLALILLFTRR